MRVDLRKMKVEEAEGATQRGDRSLCSYLINRVGLRTEASDCGCLHHTKTTPSSHSLNNNNLTILLWFNWHMCSVGVL